MGFPRSIRMGLAKVFARKLEQYRTGKGTLQFPIDQPIPLELVRQIVELRVKENSAKSRK